MQAWTWLLQRISAAVLLVALGTHLALLHFSKPGGPLTHGDVLQRLKSPLIVGLDILLLLFGLYHALYGLYAVYQDFDSGPRERVVVLGLMVLAGLGFAGFGLWGLLFTAGLL